MTAPLMVYVRADGNAPPDDGLVMVISGGGKVTTAPVTPKNAATLIRELAAWLKTKVPDPPG